MLRRYGLELEYLPESCDGYGANLTIKHTLACKNGGLVVSRHNKVEEESGGIVIQSLGSNMVCNEPKIITYCDTPVT